MDITTDATTTLRRPSTLTALADALAALPAPTGRPHVVATDGSRVPSCDGDVGGWAFAVEVGDDTVTRRGAVRQAARPITSSRMELRAVLEALRANRDTPWLLLLVDSRSTVTVLRHLERYCRRQLRSSSGRPLADDDLLRAIAREMAGTPDRAVHVTWVKAHASTQLNQVVDQAARSCARRAAKRVDRAARLRPRTHAVAAA